MCKSLYDSILSNGDISGACCAGTYCTARTDGGRTGFCQRVDAASIDGDVAKIAFLRASDSGTVIALCYDRAAFDGEMSRCVVAADSCNSHEIAARGSV